MVGLKLSQGLVLWLFDFSFFFSIRVGGFLGFVFLGLQFFRFLFIQEIFIKGLDSVGDIVAIVLVLGFVFLEFRGGGQVVVEQIVIKMRFGKEDRCGFVRRDRGMWFGEIFLRKSCQLGDRRGFQRAVEVEGRLRSMGEQVWWRYEVRFILGGFCRSGRIQDCFRQVVGNFLQDLGKGRDSRVGCLVRVGVRKFLGCQRYLVIVVCGIVWFCLFQILLIIFFFEFCCFGVFFIVVKYGKQGSGKKF